MTDQQKLELEALIEPLKEACKRHNFNLIVSLGEKNISTDAQNLSMVSGKSQELFTMLAYMHYNIIRSLKGLPE